MYDIATRKFTGDAPVNKDRQPGLRVLEGEVDFLKYVAGHEKASDFASALVAKFGQDYYWRLSDVSYAELVPISSKVYYAKFGDGWEFAVDFTAPTGKKKITVVVSKNTPDYCDEVDPDHLKEWGCLPHLLVCSTLRIQQLSDLLVLMPGVRFHASSEHFVFTANGLTFDILAS